jgi:CheY-like chemotaxis protein
MRLTAGLPRRCLAGLRILIVDDDVRDALVAVAMMYGAEVEASGSAEDARVRLEEREYDLLISDVEMPGEDGCSLIEHVRALGGERGAIRAAAFTGRDDAGTRARALASGFDQVVSKSLELRELIAVIRSVAALPR